MFQDFPCFSFSIRWLQSNCPSSCDPGRRKAIDQSHGRWPGDLLHECSKIGGVCLEEGTKQLGKPMEKPYLKLEVEEPWMVSSVWRCFEMFQVPLRHGNLTSGLWSCSPPFRGCAVHIKGSVPEWTRERCQKGQLKKLIWDDFLWCGYLEEGISGVMFNPVKSCKVHIQDPPPGEAQDKELKKMQQRQMRLCSYAEKLEPWAPTYAIEWIFFIKHVRKAMNGWCLQWTHISTEMEHIISYLFIIILLNIQMCL